MGGGKESGPGLGEVRDKESKNKKGRRDKFTKLKVRLTWFDLKN